MIFIQCELLYSVQVFHPYNSVMVLFFLVPSPLLEPVRCSHLALHTFAGRAFDGSQFWKSELWTAFATSNQFMISFTRFIDLLLPLIDTGLPSMLGAQTSFTSN